MNNIDRVLRILYSDSDLCSLLVWDFGHDWNSASIALKINDLLSTKFFFTLPCHTRSTGTKQDEQWQFMTERYMQMYPHDYSDNEVAVIFNSVFEGAENAFPFQELNSAFLFPYCAKNMLVQKDGELYVKREMLFEWEGLNNKIDSNVVFSAFDAFVSGRPTTHISAKQLDSRLRKILAKGLSDNHAHLNGSGYSPEINWYAFHDLFFTQRGRCLQVLQELIRGRWRDLDESKQKKIVLAFEKVPVVRALLAAYKLSISDNHHDDFSMSFTVDELDDMLQRVFLVQDDVTLELLIGGDDFAPILNIGHSRMHFEGAPESVGDVISIEQELFYELFLMLKEGVLSKTAIYALNVYIAAISQFKFCVAQDNRNMGFKRFSRFEVEKDVFCDCVDYGKRLLYRSVFEKYYRCGGVRYVELRIAPKSRKELRLVIDSLDTANEYIFVKQREINPDLKKIKYGIIVHYIKDENLPVTDMWVGRKERLQDRAWKQFLSLWSLYESGTAYFDYLRKIVGIDAANFEMTTRPEVFAPLFLMFKKEITSQYNTGITYHAGEDFTTLANGLRAVDEALKYIGLDEGDRIGHATALGLDADEYFRAKRGYITISLQEHVDDLAWMHGLINGSNTRDANLLGYLEKQYYKYTRELYEHTHIATPRLDVYQASMEMRGQNPEELFTKRWLNVIDYSHSSREDVYNKPDFYYFVYQYDEQSKKNGLRSLVLQADSDYMDAVKLVQMIMIRKVHDRQVTVEANPTSNRKISFVRHFSDLQIFRLNSRGLTLPDDMRCDNSLDIPVTINTDDSGIFQTDLAMEYALVVEALRRKKIGTEEIYPYIDYLRELSLMQSFVNGKNAPYHRCEDELTG